MKAVIVSIVLGFAGVQSQAHEGGGLVGAAFLQRMIINQCITRAEVGLDVDRGSLNEQYSDADWGFLYVLGLKIYAAEASYDYHGEIIKYPCDKHFPYLVNVHFFNGVKAETLNNLKAEIQRLRPDLD